MATSDPTAFTLGPSLLFCPADRPERFSKAAERSDAVIIDLEDAVAAGDKAAARQAVRTYFGQLDTAERSRTVVRINPAGTQAYDDDVEVLAALSPQYVMLAKVESVEQLEAVHRSLPNSGVIPLCETAAGIAAAYQIAAHRSVVAMMWGAEDLIASIGGTSSRKSDGSYRDIARYARSTVLMAAASCGKVAIDAIYADISDDAGLAAEAADALGSGFAAKACIHPGQVKTIRDAYRPTDEQLEYAQALLAEVQHHGGVFQFRGAMVDGPLIRHAERLIARA